MDVAASENFRHNLAEAIEAFDLQKKDVAEQAGTSRAHLDRVLKGEAVCTLPLCDRFAHAVRLPLLALLASRKDFSQAVLTRVPESVHS